MEHPHPVRRKLPDTRKSITHGFRIFDQDRNLLEGVIVVGLYPDEMPGEIFVEIQEDATLLGPLVDSWAIMVSMALQYGVPLESIVKKFAYTRFEPSGHTDAKIINFAHSVLDYVARWLGFTFICDYHGQST